MWCHCGITQPVAVQHYGVQQNPRYGSTQAARVTAADRRNLLFKFLPCKHATSLWLSSLSSHPLSDCCGELLLREYHQPFPDTNTYSTRSESRLLVFGWSSTQIYTVESMQTRSGTNISRRNTTRNKTLSGGTAANPLLTSVCVCVSAASSATSVSC